MNSTRPALAILLSQVALAQGAPPLSPTGGSGPPLEPLGGCVPDWTPTYGPRPGAHGPVAALTVFDDGSGPELIVGGLFFSAGEAICQNIAKWNGSSWSPLGDGIIRRISELLVFDDGSGEELYTGGQAFAMRWDGSTWTTLATINAFAYAYALAAFDDGTGRDLYMAGSFTTVNGMPIDRIARWNGSTWSEVGGGLNGVVHDLIVYDDGTGEALFAAGEFQNAGGGANSSWIAKWDGSSWTSLGGGVNGAVFTLETFDDGTGLELFAGGAFSQADGGVVNRTAKWNGSSWSPLASGTNGDVHDLEVHDDGSGPALYAGGLFTSAGGSTARKIAKWDGSAWSSLPNDPDFPDDNDLLEFDALKSYDDGTGPTLFAGGLFTNHPNSGMTIGRWSGSSWEKLGFGLTGIVTALEVYDDGGGDALYAGGSFNDPLTRFVKWNGSKWVTPPGVGGPGSGDIYDMLPWDDGAGEALFVVGDNFGVRRWKDLSWSTPGGGLNNDGHALALFDDGSGEALYVGGSFTFVDNASVSANRIAKWDGSTWSALGAGMNDDVLAIAVFDDGGGPALYAAGRFTLAGGASAMGIARWKPESGTWSSLGSGVSGALRRVEALAVFDDGGGPALYAAGSFTSAGGSTADDIAKWDGSSWSSVGAQPFNRGVSALQVFDDGNGPALYVTGDSSFAPTSLRDVMKWDGSTWTGLNAGFDAWARCMTVFDSGGNSLVVGGNFRTSPAKDSAVARWGCAPPPAVGTPFCLASAGCPCGNDEASGQAGCVNSTGGGARLEVAGGTASVALDDLVLHASGHPPGNSALYFMGATSFAPIAVGDGLACTGGLFRFFPGAVDFMGGFDLSSPVSQVPFNEIQPGETRYFQSWSRDVLCGPPPTPCPTPCGQESNLSSGIAVPFVP